MDPLAYYTTQSPMTDPGEHVGLFADLPGTIYGLCRVVHGVYIHYQENNIQFDVYDVPREQFLVGGKAWQMCRAGDADPNGFGIGDFRGLWFIRNNMIQDLAAQNKMEPLNWDNWGLMLRGLETLTDKEWRLLDKVAMLTQADNKAFTEMRAIYEEEIGLKMQGG